ncbi:MAG TPA: lysylphosphatidylglycerol synthase transmembrane domain-containing protein [Chloroflexota bacterium]|nr:lysylphosphatidylglycerol synthase transmembrane domain-containing protein [Chloroflexota bacterium]
MREQPLASDRPLLLAHPSLDRLRRLLPLAMSVTCVGLLLMMFWGRLPAVLRTVQEANVPLLGLAILFYLLSLYVLAMRMRYVFRVFQIEQTSNRYFLYTLIGLFFSNFLPTAMGGDLLKASYAAGYTNRLAEAFTATFVDRGLGVLGIVVIGSAALSFHPTLHADGSLVWLAPALVAGFVAVAAVCHVDRWTDWGIRRVERLSLASRARLPEIMRAALQLMRAPRMLLLTAALTLLSQLIASLCLWATAEALGIHQGFAVFLVVLPAMTVASMVPSINGMGVREATLVALLYGVVPEEQALALALVFYGLALVCSGLGGVVFLFRKPLGLRLSPRLVARFAREP